MKRALVVFVFLAGILVLSESVARAEAWQVGVKGGVNMADLSGDDAGDTSTRTGFGGGVFAGRGINDRFGVRLEGLFVNKGAEGKEDVGDGHLHDATLKLDYIEFPLLFVAKFPAGEKVGFSIFAGPTFGFNIKAEEEVAEHGTEDLGDYTQSFEFGAGIGVGVDYMLSSATVGVELRYTLGATNVFEDVQGVSSDIKNQGIGIMAALAFPLGE